MRNLLEFCLYLPFQFFGSGVVRGGRRGVGEVLDRVKWKPVWTGSAAVVDKRYECGNGASVGNLIILAVIGPK